MNQHHYPMAIPATAALASADPRDERAAAILANDVIGNNEQQSSEAALREWEMRKLLRLQVQDAVTAAEVQASRRRLMMVEAAEARAMYGTGNLEMMNAIQGLTVQIAALPTAAQFDAINAKFDAINAQIAALPIAAQFDAINAQIAALPTAAAIDTQFAILTARMNNMRARRVNHEQRLQDGPWEQLVVEQEGVNAIGTAPANQPASSNAATGLSLGNIANLEQAFNLAAEAFGPGLLADRRGRVRAFYTVEY